MEPNNIVDRITAQALLPLFYHDDPAVCVDVVKALYSSGIKIIEFTNRGKFALENFKALIHERDKTMKDLLLAVGTIKTSSDAEAFINAGADFLVSPVFDEGVNKAAKAKNILWIPGCMTATEIHRAEQEGYSLVKIFPGDLLKPAFIKATKDLFPRMKFIVTGGVEATQENISSWFTAGAAAVGMGSKLITAEILRDKNYTQLAQDATNALALITAFRKNP